MPPSGAHEDGVAACIAALATLAGAGVAAALIAAPAAAADQLPGGHLHA